MRSRSKGNNNMQAMGCFETDHAQPRSKSPKARTVQYSEQQPMCNLYVQYSASSIRWRSGWSRGWSRFANDLRVKGGDGLGQLGSVGDHFWGKYIFVRQADGASYAGRLLYEVQAPCGAPRNTQKRPRTDPEHPDNPTLGPPGAAVDHGTPRPADQETQPIATSSIGLPLFFLGFSLFPRHVVYGAVVHGRKGRRQSARSRHSTMTSFRHPCSIVRHCSSYELTHPSSVNFVVLRVQAGAGRPFRAVAVMGKCLIPLLGIPRSWFLRCFCCCC